MSDLLGSHVSMKAPHYFLGSVQEAVQNEATALMIFTGAPQNTRRQPTGKLKIQEGTALLKQHQLTAPVVHAPYIVNLANTLKPENLAFAQQFMAEEIQRADALGACAISFHPGAHVGAGPSAAISQLAESLGKIIDSQQQVTIGLETMAGKGTEIGRNFEELAEIMDQCPQSDKLSITFDTCHVFDAGYDLVHDLDGVLAEFDATIGLNRISVVHVNDSKNPCGSHKDRHTNIGQGCIGFETLNKIVHHPAFARVPKILETPYVEVMSNGVLQKISPYRTEMKMLRQQEEVSDLTAAILADQKS